MLDEIKRRKEDLLILKNYVDKETKNIESSMSDILKDVDALANTFAFKDEIERITLASMLVTRGYLSKDSSYTYDTNMKESKFMANHLLNYSCVSLEGKGCCRHTSALIKLLLDELLVESGVAMLRSGLAEDKNIDKLELMMDDFFRNYSKANHAANYVRYDGDVFIFEPLKNSSMLAFYSIDKSFVKAFENYGKQLSFKLLNTNVEEYNTKDALAFVYNYDLFSSTPREMGLDKVTELEKEKQDLILQKYDQAFLTILGNPELLSDFREKNEENVMNINKSYQKILINEKMILKK